ncbi:MAG: DUF202 domain-containing protein [Nocardioidaceae bacterium]
MTEPDPTQPADEAPVDYRFLLANERTALAYVRTALSLQVAGIAVLQFLTQGHDAVRYLLGLALVGAGSLAAVAGLRRTRANDHVIRTGGHMTSPRGAVVVTGVVIVVPLVAAVVLAVL